MGDLFKANTWSGQVTSVVVAIILYRIIAYMYNSNLTSVPQGPFQVSYQPQQFQQTTSPVLTGSYF